MEFLKIISDDSSMEIMPLNKIFSIKVIMGKLYINGENKFLKVENSEEFLNKYAGIIGEEMYKVFMPSSIIRILCIKNIDGYAEISVESIKNKPEKL